MSLSTLFPFAPWPVPLTALSSRHPCFPGQLSPQHPPLRCLALLKRVHAGPWGPWLSVVSVQWGFRPPQVSSRNGKGQLCTDRVPTL